MKSAFLLSKGLLCLYDKQNNTWLLVDMEFLFSCSTRYLTRLLRSLVSYRVKYSKRTSISTRARVLLFSLSLSLSLSLCLFISLSLSLCLSLYIYIHITLVKTLGNFILKCTYCMAVHNILRDICTVQWFPDSWKFTTHCYHKTSHSSYKRSVGRKKIPLELLSLLFFISIDLITLLNN